MKNYLSKNKFGFLLFVFTIVLAVIVLFTALRLYQLKNSPITLVAPGESEASQDNIISCQMLVINFGASPSPSPSVSPSASPTATPSSSPSASSSASPSSTSSPTATPSTGSSASPTATPTANATSTPTTKPTSVATATSTATPATLPVAGFSAPTIIGMVLAGVLLIGAFLLAI